MTNNKIWRQFVYKTGVWLAAEIWLNAIGIDDLADYSEFVFAQDLYLNEKNRLTVKIAEYPPQFCLQINDFCPLPGAAIKLNDESCDRQAETVKNKCQQLNEPCIKIMCLETNI